MIGQMARYYKVPENINTLGGKDFDAQAGYESATTLIRMMSGNYIWHSAGWNEVRCTGDSKVYC